MESNYKKIVNLKNIISSNIFFPIFQPYSETFTFENFIISVKIGSNPNGISIWFQDDRLPYHVSYFITEFDNEIISLDENTTHMNVKEINMENLPIMTWYNWKYFEKCIPEKLVASKIEDYVFSTTVTEWTKLSSRTEKIIDLYNFENDFEKILNDFLKMCKDTINENNELPILKENGK